jgi:PilZ domain
MKRSNCPKCSGEFIRRVSRRGLLEQLLSGLYIYPFRCQLCGHRFRLQQWGEVYRKTFYDGREFERLPVSLNASVWKESGEHGSGMLRDISARGCGMTTDVALARGNILRLELHIPDEAVPIVVQAAVVRNVSAPHSDIEFLHLIPPERERLRAMVRNLLASSSAPGTASEKRA